MTTTAPVTSAPLLVRNCMPGVTMFSDPPNRFSVEFAARGDATGGDFQQVPASLADNIAFIRAVSRGVLEVVEMDDGVREKLEQSNARWRRQRDETDRALEASMDRSSEQPMVTEPCVGPGMGQDNRCGDAVYRRPQEAQEKPPLCPRHQHLAHEYVITHDVEQHDEDGASVPVWERMGMGPRERAVQQ